MFYWVTEHPGLLWWLLGVSVATFAGVPLLVVAYGPITSFRVNIEFNPILTWTALIEKNLLGVLHRLALLDHPRRILGKLIELAARFFKTRRGAAIGRIHRRSRAPHFVGLPNMITRVFQQQGIGGNLRIPDRAL